jgi:hypothetical protein
LSSAGHNYIFSPAKIIPEKGNIQISQGNIAARQQLFQTRNNPARQEYSSWLEANNDRFTKIIVVFNQLKTKTVDRDVKIFLVQDQP